ncbi:MAG TPA: hypothetical protein VFE33_29875 [Thermoanaerobaculia bacterium]|nr:hypothetical protein [Thermoanaerobaculia bacterium]
MTRKLADILTAVRDLSSDERRRLIIELDSLQETEHPDVKRSPEPLATLLRLAGTAHSEFTDLSTNKYAHVAAAVLDHKG